MSAAALVAAAALAAAPLPAAGDWPQWRGPAHDGVSRETGWTDAGRPLWSKDVGLGHSSASVAGGRLYTLGFDAEREVDVVWCLDAETGAEVWTQRYTARLRASGHGGGTHSTPTVAAGTVFVSNREGEVRAYDAATGEPRWKRELTLELGVEPNEYGYGGSPLVLGERVFVNAGKVAALDAATGAVLWSTPDHLAMYSTPTPLALGGATRVASFTKEGLYVLAQDTGAELFHFPWRKGEVSVNAATPVAAGERIFISSGYGHGCALVELGEDGARAVWESKVLRTVLSGAVLVDGHLYGFDESKLKCVDLDGEERWRKRGLGQGALMAADGRLILMSEKGELIVARATPEAYTELSKERVMDGGHSWTTPALAGGRIYCRNGQGRLVARDHRPE